MGIGRWLNRDHTDPLLKLVPNPLPSSPQVKPKISTWIRNIPHRSVAYTQLTRASNGNSETISSKALGSSWYRLQYVWQTCTVVPHSGFRVPQKGGSGSERGRGEEVSPCHAQGRQALCIFLNSCHVNNAQPEICVLNGKTTIIAAGPVSQLHSALHQQTSYQ